MRLSEELGVGSEAKKLHLVGIWLYPYKEEVGAYMAFKTAVIGAGKIVDAA